MAHIASKVNVLRNSLVFLRPQLRMMTNGYGSGEGKGGGSGGAVRSAGGAFGKMEAAREEEYFRRLQKQQLEALYDHHRESVKNHEDEIQLHKASIKKHEDALKRHTKLRNRMVETIKEVEDKKKSD